MNFWVILALFAMAQGIFLALVLLFHGRGNRPANRILAVLIFLFSLRLAEFVGYWTKFFLAHPHFAFTTVSFQFLFGVLLYLYAKTLTDTTPCFRKLDILHFAPFLVQIGLLMPFYSLAGTEKIAILNKIIYTDNPVLSTRFFIIEGLQDLHMLTYTFLTIRLIARNGRRAGPTLTLERINLKWLRNLTLGFGLFILIDMFHLLDLRLFGYEHVVTVDSALLFLSALLIYLLGYLALRQPEVISGISNLMKRAPRYEKSSLTPQRAEGYLRKLVNSMENDRLYLRSDLNLQNLSKTLAISTYHLSQILNEKLNQNFFDFVNRYRVEEAKRLLSQPETGHFTILSIAHDVGFNNKASFNSAFKKHTGITPSQFRASVSRIS